MRVILVLLFCMIASPVYAWQDWDQKTREQFAATSVSIGLDWHSTDMAARNNWHNRNYHELNPVLGEHPTRGEIGLYMIGRLGLQYYLYDNGYNNFANFAGAIHTFAAINNYQLTGDNDKIVHAVAGLAISTAVTNYTGSKVKGCLASIAAGIVKETIDSRTHDFDVDDAIATGLGCGFSIRF